MTPSPSRTTSPTATVAPTPISSHQSPTPTPTPAPSVEGKCSDGLDNDGDGAVDGADGGCKSPSDNDERNVIRVGTRTSASHQASPHRFRGVVKAARKVCIKGRKVRVEEFNGFGFGGADRTDRRGRWSIPHTRTDPSWTYLVAVDEKTIKTSKLIIVCKSRVRGVNSPD
ncbi:MAG TPA: hypothetical protein VNC78_10840 [Actinomycetota bacterium]|nr:hypothetical protein [Actinomycetota bacterium]